MRRAAALALVLCLPAVAIRAALDLLRRGGRRRGSGWISAVFAAEGSRERLEGGVQERGRTDGGLESEKRAMSAAARRADGCV